MQKQPKQVPQTRLGHFLRHGLKVRESYDPDSRAHTTAVAPPGISAEGARKTRHRTGTLRKHQPDQHLSEDAA